MKILIVFCSIHIQLPYCHFPYSYLFIFQKRKHLRCLIFGVDRVIRGSKPTFPSITGVSPLKCGLYSVQFVYKWIMLCDSLLCVANIYQQKNFCLSGLTWSGGQVCVNMVIFVTYICMFKLDFYV